MLTLASMIWAAFFFVADKMNMVHRPTIMPVVISREGEYGYNDIESAIYVPSDWRDDCYDQRMIVYYMAIHYNNYRNGKQKLPATKLDEISREWKCLEDKTP